MAGLFRRSKSGPKTIDKIWISEAAKFKAIRNAIDSPVPYLFVFWFRDSLDRMSVQEDLHPEGENDLLLARDLHSIPENQQLIFAEHYPFLEKEIRLFAQLALTTVEVWSALDEPLFLRFGGQGITTMMHNLGMDEESAVQHELISKAIHQAQEKIGKKIGVDQGGDSQRAWLQRNLPD